MHVSHVPHVIMGKTTQLQLQGESMHIIITAAPIRCVHICMHVCRHVCANGINSVNSRKTSYLHIHMTMVHQRTRM